MISYKIRFHVIIHSMLIYQRQLASLYVTKILQRIKYRQMVH